MNPFESKVLCFLFISFLNGFFVSFIHKRRRLLYSAEKSRANRSKGALNDDGVIWLELFFYRYVPHFFALLVPFYFLIFAEQSIWYSSLLFVLSLAWAFLISWGGGKQSFEEVFNSVDAHPVNIPKRTHEITNEAILNYTRITFFKMSNHTSIFDSSDYDFINEYFGTKQGKQPVIAVGYKVVIENRNYKIANVEIDLLNIFDDYKVVGKSDVNKGRPIPYNIQVRVYVDDMEIA